MRVPDSIKAGAYFAALAWIVVAVHGAGAQFAENAYLSDTTGEVIGFLGVLMVAVVMYVTLRAATLDEDGRHWRDRCIEAERRLARAEEELSWHEKNCQ